MLVKSYIAAAAILAYRAVVWDVADSTVKQATDGTAPFVGTTGIVGADAANDMVDVTRLGLPEVVLGAAVNHGDRLMADADGKAIACTAGNFYFGFAEVTGVAGDVINYLAAPGKM
jgi:hypothetical protein